MFRSISSIAAAGVAALFLAAISGCITLQDSYVGKWMEPAPPPPVHEVMAIWDNYVRVTQDTNRGLAPVPGLAGRVFLFSEETQLLDATGTIQVEMCDMSTAAQGGKPKQIAVYQFDAQTLKKLKKKCQLGDGYTLFLPWENYRPDTVKQIQLRACYVDEKHKLHYSNPMVVSLRSEERVPITHQQQIVPTADPVPTKK